MLNEVAKAVQACSFDFSSEKKVQHELDIALKPLGFKREYRLSKKDIIDFYHPEEKIGIEVKIKGPASAILRQCTRYCEFEEIQSLILMTSWSLGWPESINDKPTYYMSLSKLAL